MQEALNDGFDPWVGSPLGKEMATRSSIYAGELSTEEPRRAAVHRVTGSRTRLGTQAEAESGNPDPCEHECSALCADREGLHSPRQRSTATQLKSSDNTERSSGGLSPEPSSVGSEVIRVAKALEVTVGPQSPRATG